MWKPFQPLRSPFYLQVKSKTSLNVCILGLNCLRNVTKGMLSAPGCANARSNELKAIFVVLAPAIAKLF